MARHFAAMSLARCNRLLYGMFTLVDGLLHSGFLHELPVDPNDPWHFSTRRVGPMADLADGRVEAQHQIAPRDGIFTGHPLRGVDDLRSISYRDQWRQGHTEWEPVVVLTHQKGRTVSQWSFDLAYGSFTHKLADADRWLIGGYGRGDEPVNNAFRQALQIRRRIRRKPSNPALLVVDRGDYPDARRDGAVEAIGIRSNVVSVNLDGLPAALDSDEWHDWSS